MLTLALSLPCVPTTILPFALTVNLVVSSVTICKSSFVQLPILIPLSCSLSIINYASKFAMESVAFGACVPIPNLLLSASQKK